jgi:hypothetical protein
VRREKVVVKEEATNATFFDFAFELNGFGSRVERKGMEDAPRNTGLSGLRFAGIMLWKTGEQMLSRTYIEAEELMTKEYISVIHKNTKSPIKKKGLFRGGYRIFYPAVGGATDDPGAGGAML